MPLYLDVHNVEGGVSARDGADAHMKDLETQGTYGVNYRRYCVDERTGKIFCLLSGRATRRPRLEFTAKRTGWSPTRSTKSRKASRTSRERNCSRSYQREP
jgi:hypothetical protein